MKMILEDLLRGKHRVALGGHVRPDGDCIGSCMGLYLYILENYPEKQTDIYLEELPDSFHFLQRSGRGYRQLCKRDQRLHGHQYLQSGCG